MMRPQPEAGYGRAFKGSIPKFKSAGENKMTWPNEELLRTFALSEDVRNQLREHELSERQIADLIFWSPVPLETKYKWATGTDKEEIGKALEELNAKNGEVFCAQEYCYDDETLDLSSSSPYVSDTFESIRWSLDWLQPEEFDAFWAIADKWCPFEHSIEDSINGLQKTYSYVIFGEQKQPVFFNRHIRNREIDSENPGRYNCSTWPFTRTDVTLPISFPVGTILRLDCRPFYPEQLAIVAFNDPYERCTPTVLHQNSKGKFRSFVMHHPEMYRPGPHRSQDIEALPFQLYRVRREKDPDPVMKEALQDALEKYLAGEIV